jgi:hypothetical protein
MTGQFGLLSLVFMIGFVVVFDRMRDRHKLDGWLRSGKLMSEDELKRIQAIWSACQDN